MELKILPIDICDAKRDSELDCPIARALLRRFPGNTIDVFDEYILINGVRFEHTERSQEYAFDWNDGEAQPDTLPFPNIGNALRASAR